MAPRLSASTWCSPSLTACRLPTPCASGRNPMPSPACVTKSRSFPPTIRCLPKPSGKAPSCSASSPRRKAARSRKQRRASPMAATTRACSPRLIPAPRQACRNFRTRRRAQARSTGCPSTTRSSAACPWWFRSATSSIPPSPPTCCGSRKAPRPTWSNRPARAARRRSARRPASSKSASATTRFRPKPTVRCGSGSPSRPRSAICRPGRC